MTEFTLVAVASIVCPSHNMLLLQDPKGEVARNYRLEGFRGSVSFVTSMTKAFCSDCNRIRLMADGNLKAHPLPLAVYFAAVWGGGVLCSCLGGVLLIKKNQRPSAEMPRGLMLLGKRGGEPQTLNPFIQQRARLSHGCSLCWKKNGKERLD